jgi:hypothetical protein
MSNLIVFPSNSVHGRCEQAGGISTGDVLWIGSCMANTVFGKRMSQ